MWVMQYHSFIILSWILNFRLGPWFPILSHLMSLCFCTIDRFSQNIKQIFPLTFTRIIFNLKSLMGQSPQIFCNKLIHYIVYEFLLEIDLKSFLIECVLASKSNDYLKWNFSWIGILSYFISTFIIPCLSCYFLTVVVWYILWPYGYTIRLFLGDYANFLSSH